MGTVSLGQPRFKAFHMTDHEINREPGGKMKNLNTTIHEAVHNMVM